ncbi:helix-turn-helix domain-containing protein [Streptomyces sp. NPDC058486]|uniref:helix-turn-helix domain-containing protein n=1 Tax=unclassified Streptomyces TaxID=2593676 RepID=UPI00365B899D
MLREVLVKVRLRHGWTQEELSERSGLSVRTIRNLETGKVSNPRRASLRLLSSVLAPEEKALLAPAPEGEPAPRRQEMSTPRDTIVGRHETVAFLTEALRAQRLVTLVGPGGVGKSRLALALAEAVTTPSGDGVSVIGLGTMPPERFAPQESFDRISAALTRAVTRSAQGQPQVVILDDAELVSASVTRLGKRIVADHPELRLIITTRLRLPLNAACVWEVTPLALESSDGGVPAAAQLFLRRASAWFPGLAAGMDLEPVRQLCALLDGNPRYLEFAAERLRSVGLDDLLALLRSNDSRLKILRSADASLLPHQRDVVTSVERSLQLLDPVLRSFLARLAHFDGDFLLSDIEGLAALDHYARLDFVHMLAQLADHSVVQVIRGDEYRYRLTSGVRSVLIAGAESELLVNGS